MRALLNRWRRRVWQALFYRMVFGEQDGMGRPLAHTRIAPSTCIEGAAGLQLADHLADFPGRVLSPGGQGAYFISHDSEAPARFASTGRFNRCVKG